MNAYHQHFHNFFFFNFKLVMSKGRGHMSYQNGASYLLHSKLQNRRPFVTSSVLRTQSRLYPSNALTWTTILLIGSL